MSGQGAGPLGGALGIRATANGRRVPLPVPPSPWRWRPEPGASAHLEPSGWRHHGVRRAAFCVPDPAACAPVPRACSWPRRTHALPGCEWGVGRGRQLSGPGVVSGSVPPGRMSPCVLLGSLSLTVSPCPRRFVCLTVSGRVFPSRSVWGLVSVSLSLCPCCFHVSLYLAALVTHSVSFLLSPCLWFSITALVPHTRDTPHLCVWGWGCQHFTTEAVAVPLWQPQAGLIHAMGLEE